MEDKVLNHLKNKFNPDAIILHGSRARGMEREHSDWDIILLYVERPDILNGRELLDGQNIEFSISVLPIEDIFATFSTKLRGAKVLYEHDGEGTQLLKQAENYYALGVHWSAKKIASHKLWFQGRINGMNDTKDTPELFYKYFSDIYLRVTNYWYWILQHTHSQPMYIALKEIENQDNEYFQLIQDLSNPKLSLEEKVVVVEKIKNKLFLRSS